MAESYMCKTRLTFPLVVRKWRFLAGHQCFLRGHYQLQSIWAYSHLPQSNKDTLKDPHMIMGEELVVAEKFGLRVAFPSCQVISGASG